jgi:hypothetical protein
MNETYLIGHNNINDKKYSSLAHNEINDSQLDTS